jgi:transcriptional regulator with XRE-family HTH domain
MKTFKRLREEALLTQKELAAACGVSKQTVWEWEHAYARPSPENLKKLMAVLRKDVSELLDALDATAKETEEKPAV